MKFNLMFCGSHFFPFVQRRLWQARRVWQAAGSGKEGGKAHCRSPQAGYRGCGPDKPGSSCQVHDSGHPGYLLPLLQAGHSGKQIKGAAQTYTAHDIFVNLSSTHNIDDGGGSNMLLSAKQSEGSLQLVKAFNMLQRGPQDWKWLLHPVFDCQTRA